MDRSSAASPSCPSCGSTDTIEHPRDGRWDCLSCKTNFRDPSAAHKRELDALELALANNIEYPTKLVGRHVPDWAREWGERNNLTVRESEFAPRGMLYVIGAIPVVDGIERTYGWKP